MGVLILKIYDLNHAWYALGREWPWIAGSLSEPMFCDFLGIVNEGFTIPKIVFSIYIFVKMRVGRVI